MQLEMFLEDRARQSTVTSPQGLCSLVVKLKGLESLPPRCGNSRDLLLTEWSNRSHSFALWKMDLESPMSSVPESADSSFRINLNVCVRIIKLVNFDNLALKFGCVPINDHQLT